MPAAPLLFFAFLRCLALSTSSRRSRGGIGENAVLDGLLSGADLVVGLPAAQLVDGPVLPLALAAARGRQKQAHGGLTFSFLSSFDVTSVLRVLQIYSV